MAVALGVGSLVERSAVLFHTIKLLGAAYLIVLGVRAVRRVGGAGTWPGGRRTARAMTGRPVRYGRASGAG
ncbi:hypothetical protein AB0K85_22705 [Streptomyces cellulosae]